MSDTTASLSRKIGTASDLQSVVRTMKAMAASSIGQYEKAVGSLDDYYRTVQMGLSVCFRDAALAFSSATGATSATRNDGSAITAIVFGSDQGLVGQFNEMMFDFVTKTLDQLPGEKGLWAVGERIQSGFADAQMMPARSFSLPNSIGAISQLVGQILIQIEAQRQNDGIAQVYLFYNRPVAGAGYQPVSQRLLPLDNAWRDELKSNIWPSKNLPEVMPHMQETLLAFVREYLFVSLFKACVESLASENASRLAAMQRAEKNIDELLEDLNRTFHRLRQSSIDEELFDVVSGFESLGKP
jgi:F-type H+-transporting ATPase subunit gamma